MGFSFALLVNQHEDAGIHRVLLNGQNTAVVDLDLEVLEVI